MKKTSPMRIVYSFFSFRRECFESIYTRYMFFFFLVGEKEKSTRLLDDNIFDMQASSNDVVQVENETMTTSENSNRTGVFLETVYESVSSIRSFIRMSTNRLE